MPKLTKYFKVIIDVMFANLLTMIIFSNDNENNLERFFS